METQFEKQSYAAYKIVSVKLKEWMKKIEKYVPKYIADFLFSKNGEIIEMLNMGGEQAFYYDPETLENGVEMVLKLLENIEFKDLKKVQSLYKNFADSKTRIEYLFNIIDKLDIYSSVEELVVSDLDEYAKKQTDPELLEIIENRKKNIKARAEIERKAKTSNGFKQPS